MVFREGQEGALSLLFLCVLTAESLLSTAHRPVPVTSDMELSVMKNKIAELKAQIGKDPSRDRTASHPERDGSFVRTLAQPL